MDELFQLIKKSKTAKAGITSIVWGILLLFGVGGQSGSNQTIDTMTQPPKTNWLQLLGVGSVMSGARTLEGRKDAEKKIKELENNAG